MPRPEDSYDDWFAAGMAVFWRSTDPADFPPLDNRAAQRAWLGGFGAAWAECPQNSDEPWCDEEVDIALTMALDGREGLLECRELNGFPFRSFLCALCVSEVNPYFL
jgi:hypothetical protein